MRRMLVPLALIATLGMDGSALATYSIVAVDRDLQIVGGAGTSCVGRLSVSVILGVAPGVGAVHAQATLNENGRDEAVGVLERGGSPDDAIAAITDPSFDSGAATRQYGVVDLMGRSAAYTGDRNKSFAGDVQGEIEAYVYSVQGNILTSDKVLDQARAGFEGDGCDLPDRLMLALEAGAANGEGDSRCTPQGIPSDSAFLRLVHAGGELLIDIDVTDTGNANPLEALRSKFDTWRVTNPCPDDDDETETSNKPKS